MKAKLIIASLFAIVFLTSFETAPVIAVNKNESMAAPGFSFFRTHRQGQNGVTATWGLSTAAGVSCFRVERTYEDPSDIYAVWDQVSSLPCNGNRSYKVTDLNVNPGFISYRVFAVCTDGTEFSTAVSTVHIVSH